MHALEVAEELEKEGIEVSVLHVPTIKPLDEQTILDEVSKGGRPILIAENHSVISGLGEAVGSLLLRNRQHSRFDMIGLPDAFLDAGALPTLHDRYGISTEAVKKKIKSHLK
ncbi:1-deoxy-D-xylulose-5-phosphate synthase [compost metagenome]